MRFHIHLNIIRLSEATRIELMDLGLENKPFGSNCVFKSQFTPIHHLSMHQSRAEDFRRLFRDVRKCLAESRDVLGYMEGEYVIRQQRFGEHGESNQKIYPGAELQLLLMPAQSWRRSEVHITIRETGASKEMISVLRNAGFLYTTMQKETGIHWIFTAQGSKSMIDAIYRHYLDLIDGQPAEIEGKIKEERSLGYWVSDGYTWIMPQVKKLITE